MTHAPVPEDTEALLLEHRDIDALLEALLAALSAGALVGSVDALVGSIDAIARLDDAIRVHSGFEEGLFPAAPEKLVTRAGDTAGDPLFRLLRLEHVQIRELSGMIRCVLGDSGDLAGAFTMAANLASRWEAHVRREEKDWLGG
ncbi:MAG: hemerythrin domain-containing protein [Acidobacteria bacterium]|nr:hemerythrin domain-containing protein [Acidobacteriota bacterium]MCA1612157.1 hemerythrin domain-containing protein [Acidobacteriota bacterium]